MNIESPTATSSEETVVLPRVDDSGIEEMADPPLPDDVKISMSQAYRLFAESDAKRQRTATKRLVLNLVGLAGVGAAVTAVYLLINGQLMPFVHKLRHPESVSTSPLATPKPYSLSIRTPAEKKHDAEVAADLKNFLWKSVRENSADEKAALDAYASVTATNFKDAPTVFTTVRKTVVPKYTSFVQKMINIHPQTPDVEALHQMLLRAIELRLKAYMDIVAAEHARDLVWQYSVKGEFEGADSLELSYKQAVVKKAQLLNVDLP